MSGDGSKLRSFLLGGIVGGVAALAAERLTARREHGRRAAPPGLAAFERAPCYEELVEREQRDSQAS
jgi:hypothetical protein